MKIIKYTFLVCAVVACLVGIQLVTDSTKVTSYIANTLFENNFHEVVPNRFYRSAEMSHDELTQAIKKNGIRTVIDLRLGTEEPNSDGIVESQTAQDAGAMYKHVSLRSTAVPGKAKIEELLTAYEQAETPVLVHCSSGTHRTGVATAIWLMIKEGKGIQEAEKQLSPEYGFFRFERAIKSWFSGKPTIDNLLWQFAKISSETGVSFQDWVKSMTPATAGRQEAASLLDHVDEASQKGAIY